MCDCTRRAALGMIAAAALAPRGADAAAVPEREVFLAAAFRLKDAAVRAGDQPYGAVIVWNREIVGFGPSRVRELGEAAGHAERVAIADAQRRLGREQLADCAMYSTSRPCAACQRAAAQAKLSRMYYEHDAADAEKP